METISAPGASAGSRTEPVRSELVYEEVWDTRPQTVRYTVRPFDHVFNGSDNQLGLNAQDNAAFNSMMLYSLVNAATGGSYEAAGYVRRLEGGGYTSAYSTSRNRVTSGANGLLTANLTPLSNNRLFNIGITREAVVDQPVPQDAVAFWHTHPLTGVSGNMYFSPGVKRGDKWVRSGDINAAIRISRLAGRRNIDGYLRGGDGVVRVVRNMNTFDPAQPIANNNYESLRPYILNGDYDLRGD